MHATATPTEPRARLLPLLAWATGATFFFYAWVLRVAPSVMVEELMRDFAVGAGVLGHLSAAYFYGYAGMQIPVGLLLDRFGPRRLMTVAALDLRRRLRAVRNRQLARHGHRRPLPDRRLGRLQPGGRHGHRRAMVSSQSLCDLLGPRHGHGHGRRRVRPGAPAAGHRGLRLAHGHAAAGGGRRHPGRGCLGHGPRQVARHRRHGRCAVGSRQGPAPSPDPADRADRTWHVRTAAGVRRSLGRAVSRNGLRHVALVGCRA